MTSSKSIGCWPSEETFTIRVGLLISMRGSKSLVSRKPAEVIDGKAQFIAVLAGLSSETTWNWAFPCTNFVGCRHSVPIRRRSRTRLAPDGIQPTIRLRRLHFFDQPRHAHHLQNPQNRPWYRFCNRLADRPLGGIGESGTSRREAEWPTPSRSRADGARRRRG